MSLPLNLKSESVAYFGVFYFLGAAMALLGPTLIYLADNVSASLASMAILFSVRSLGYLLGSFVSGRIYDRVPGHLLMGILLLITALMMALVPMSKALLHLSVLMFFIGAGTGGTDLGGNTLTMWAYTSRSGPIMNALFFFAGFGSISAPLVVARLIGAGLNILWVYWFIAVFALPFAIWLFFLTSPRAAKRTEPNHSVNIPLVLIALFGALLFVIVGVEVSYGGWIFTFTVMKHLGADSTAAMLTSAFWLAITLGRLVAIPFAARIHPAYILSAGLVGAGFSLGIMLLFPSSFPVAVAGTLGLGISIASLSPMTLSLAERTMPISGRLTGILWACGSSGAIITPWLVGQSLVRISPGSMIALLLFQVVIGLLVLGGLNMHRGGQDALPGL